jgi:hypothetical protein
MNDEIWAQFLTDRKEALMSLDETKIRDYFRKSNGFEMSTNPETFWRSVHKAITAAPYLPTEFRMASKRWLTEHGSTSLDDGELPEVKQ